MAELVLRLRDREMARVGVVKTRMTLGRDATSDLVIDNAAVSRTHASVIFHDGAYRLRDEESENGVTLNGRRVRKATLEYGDVIGIGKFEVELVDSWHEPVALPDRQPGEATKNVMKTMQVDAGTAARLRDEAMARIAAQKGLPAPAPRAPARAPAAAAPSPASEPSARSGPSMLGLVGLVVAALLAGVVLTLLIAR